MCSSDLVEFLHGGRPRREMRAVLPRPDRAPASAPEVSRHLDGVDHVATVLGLLSHPNIASKAHVIRRYDHEIRGATVIRPLVGARRDGHADGTVLAEPSEVHGLAIGIGVSGNYWVACYCQIIAISQSNRNLIEINGVIINP